MFWDTKKKESSLPDLPRSPAANTLPRFTNPLPTVEMHDELEEDDKVHELPSFPDSPMQRGFSQAAIKEAVTNEEREEETSPPELRKAARLDEPEESNYKITEMEEWSPKPIQAISSSPRGRESKPIFVRVDKFQVARNSLENVKLKLGE